MFLSNKKALIIPKYLILIWILCNINFIALAQPFILKASSDLERIYNDGYKIPNLKENIKIFGIQNEVISAQCVIYTKRPLNDVTVKLSEFKHNEQNVIIPLVSTDWHFVGNVNVTTNTPNQPLSRLERKAPALFPEYLMQEKKLNIQGGSYQAVWLTLKIPKGTIPGIYKGEVNVSSREGNASLPVELTIYPLVMPDKRNLKVTEWYTTSNWSYFHGIEEKYSEEWFDMLRLYAENMAEHRQNVFQVPASEIKTTMNPNGTFSFDFRRFDQVADVFWNTGKMDYLETGELFGFVTGSWADTKIGPKDFKVWESENNSWKTVPGNLILQELLPELEMHLRRKGWLSKTLFHVKDEPAMHNAHSWKEASRYVKNLAPDLIRIDAIETTSVLDEIDIAVPKLDALASWYDSFREAYLSGTELWFYTVGIFQGSLLPNKTIDMPLIDTRILHWMNYKYDAKGYLHWGWNHWEDDPYKDVGLHVGDGWHVYPVKEGVMNSLRWEQMRNGIQDYEYLILLEKKTKELKDSLGTRFSWIDPSRRGKEIVGQVVPGFYEQIRDPDAFYKAKQEIIQEILLFEESPRLYLQTDPAMSSEVTRHSSVAIYGWAEPSSRVFINGVEVEVAYDGLFLQQAGGEIIDPIKIPFQGKINVVIENEKGSKRLTREFYLR